MSSATLRARLLVVDDDPKILSMLRRGLSFEGYQVETAEDGPHALAAARDRLPDLVVLDVMMPGIDGIEVCRRLRTGAGDVPILMLTARDTVQDRVAGLDAGADDYLVKPFAFDELLARVRALLRRSRPAEERDGLLRFADVELSPASRQAFRGGAAINLTAREFGLLEFFLRNPRIVLTRDTIFERVWGSDFLGGTNVIDVHVKALRDKLEANGGPRLIQTVRGVGYALRET
ncbi:MAG TPA: response regulator transcription factor [Chloroflexota bacterium]|jgi:two-component system response regulator MprA|nr:response regulator transcription factor [Chloroflexota bacterium]